MMTPLPLYHIFSFTVNCMAMIESGNHSVLITNPRDLDAFINEMKNWPFTAFAGLNTLFLALCEHEAFPSVDFSHLKITLAGGMALHKSVAEKWQQITKCQICEGFGMTETAPVVCVNPPDAIQIGSVGLPVQDTQVRVVDENGVVLGIDIPGELCVKGPQVMKGYWRRDDETAKVFDKDGWLKTGDIAVIQADGYIRIVDRLKDMILVSGFNVYPNEIEDELVTHPDIRECAAIGVDDEKSGEVVKVFVVASRSTLSQQDVIQYARQRLVAYKVPKFVEFRQELPKSNVGKILRKMLREPK
jgi:long-chain acyl-CoA synthetase